MSRRPVHAVHAAGFLAACTLAVPLVAQTVECSLRAGDGAVDRGTCRGWGDAVLEVQLTPRPGTPDATDPAGSPWNVTLAAPGAPEIQAVIEAQDGTVAPARTLKAPFGWFPVESWEMRDGRIRSLSFTLSRPSPPTEVDRRILRHARDLLADGTRWDPGIDRTCPEPGARLPLYCALRTASLELAGDFHHRRPALRLVRETIQRRFPDRIQRHPLADFNGHPDTTLREVLEVLREAVIESSAASSSPSPGSAHLAAAGLDLPTLPAPVPVHYSAPRRHRPTPQAITPPPYCPPRLTWGCSARSRRSATSAGSSTTPRPRR